jgi:putative transposase
MPIFLTTLLASVRSIFQSRAALEFENLALRHQIAVLRRSAAKRLRLTSADRLLWICLSRLWHDWRSSLNHRQARNGPCLASCRLSLVLDLEGAARPTGTTCHFARGPRSDPQDVPGEPHLGCTPHPRRTAQTRHRHRTDQCRQIHGALPQAAVSDLAYISRESRQATGFQRLLHGSHDPLSGPYVFLVLAHDRRRILHFNVTAHPTAEWVGQTPRGSSL